MRHLVLLTLIIWGNSIGYATEDPIKRIFSAGGKHYMASPPEFVLSGEIQSSEWDVTGTILTVHGSTSIRRPEMVMRALVGLPIPPRVEWVYAWNHKSGKGKEVFRETPNQSLSLIEFSMRPGKGYAVMLQHKGDDIRSTFCRVDLDATPAIRPVGPTIQSPNSYISVSPTDDMAIGYAIFDDQPQFFRLSPNEVEPITIKPPENYQMTTTFLADGHHVVLRQTDRVRRDVGKAYNLLTGDIVEVSLPYKYGFESLERSDLSYREENGALWVWDSPEQLGLPTIAASELGKEAPPRGPAPKKLLQVGQCDGNYSVSFDGLKVAMVSNGSLSVSTMIEISNEQFKELTDQLSRTQVVDRAKQVGLAMLMYAADADDILPPGANINDVIMPYLKDSGLLAGFNYTYTGDPSLGNMSSPADTQLGFVQGRGGRAIIFADGHVKWFSNPSFLMAWYPSRRPATDRVPYNLAATDRIGTLFATPAMMK